MAIRDNISVARNGDVRYVPFGGDPNYTVLELHRELQLLAYEGQASGDDLLDITSNTPTARATDNFINFINSYNIDDALSQKLYDGTIIQNAGADRYDGIVNYGIAGIYIDVMQNGALLTNFWTTGLNADAAQGISHRFLVKTRTAGADIDGRRLLGLNREIGFSYGEFPINGTATGNNVLALTQLPDLNNQTAEATIATWVSITNQEGYRSIDVDANGSPENYYSEWNRDVFTINQLTERAKWLQRRGSVSTLYGLTGGIFRGITHEIDIDTNIGIFNAVEPVSWGTGATAGTGQMLAINNVSTGTKMWIQILTGVIPIDGLVITGGTSTASAAMNLTITSRTVTPTFLGISTGTAVNGAYGVGIEAADLAVSDKLTDLTDTPIAPPNNTAFAVNGLVIGEDRVLVTSEAAGGIDFAQFTLSVTLSGIAETSAVMTAAIPSDSPSAGTIRIVSDAGIDILVPYTSFAGSTFTIPSKDFSADPASSINSPNAYFGYIDKLATSVGENVTWVYNADRPLFIRVRDGGGTPIQTYQTTSAMTANGGSVTVIRTPDA